MKAYPYTPKAGDVAWVNYIPVKFVSDNYQEGTYNQKGFVAIDILSSNTGKQAWVDYVPVVIDDTRTDAWIVNSVGYIPVNFSGTGDGTVSNKGLSLNFVGASTLDPRITFSRASNATVTGSNGLIQYAPHNLMLYSEQLDNSSWTKTRSTVTANTVVAPDGTTTADAIIEDSTATSTHFVRELVTGVSGVTYTISLFLKANTRTWALVTIAGGSGYYFDVGTGAVGSSFSGTGTVSNPFCTSVGNGWYRCGFTIVAGSTNNGIDVYLATGNNVVSYTGNGTSGLYIWGAQLNVGSLQPYYPTTVKNLLGYSEAFDNAAWTKSNSTVSANTTVTAAPNGTFTADKLAEDSALSTHVIQQAFNVTSGTSYTLSCYAKAGERNFIQLLMLTGFAANITAIFDLTTGAVGTTGGSPITQAVNVGNGWWRLSITATANATVGSSAQIRPSSSSSTAFYQGVTGSGIYVWGAQLSDSASLDTYVNNPVAAPTAAAYYGARFDYDPVTLQPKGLLIEEQRTNLLLRSSTYSATWIQSNLTPTYNTTETTSPSGDSDATKFVIGGASGALLQSVTSTAVSHTASVYLKVPSGSTTVDLVMYRNSPFSVVATKTVTVTTAWQRFDVTGTFFDTTSHNFQINFGTNKTVYVWGAQLEVGAFATSYIPTTSAQVTRSADVALIQGSNFSGWYNASQGSFFTNTQIYSSFARNSAGFDIQDGSTTNNRIIYRQITTGSADQVVIRSGSTTVATLSSGAVASAGVRKTALRYKLDDFAMTTNDTLPAFDTGGAVPVGVTQMLLGSALAGSEFLNGYIRQIAYYPRTLSDSELRAITA